MLFALLILSSSSLHLVVVSLSFFLIRCLQCVAVATVIGAHVKPRKNNQRAQTIMLLAQYHTLHCELKKNFKISGYFLCNRAESFHNRAQRYKVETNF
jgi:hypothetical protein